MPKINAYKCPFTKKLFETRSGYRRHLLKLRKTNAKKRAVRKQARIAKRIRNERLAVVMAALEGARTIDEVEQAYLDHFGEMMALECRGATGFRMLEFNLFSMRYSSSVSNTHSCPRNGITNFAGNKEGAPRGYPGFSGRIEFTVDEPEDFDGWFVDVSRTVGHFGVNTGTGGGRGACPETGGKRYYYDVKLFLDDFPGLAEHVKEVHEEHKRLIFRKKLKGERVQDPVYSAITG